MKAELHEIRDKGDQLELIYKGTPKFSDSPLKLEEVCEPRPAPWNFKKGAVKLESPMKAKGDISEFEDDY